MTLTAAGARLLERRLSAPSCDLAEIRARLAAVGFWSRTPAARRPARGAAQVPDIDRALSRLSLDRGGPRDLAMLRAGAAQAAWRARLRAPRPAAPADRGCDARWRATRR
jgi:DNA mismatch repair protein MutS